MLEHGKQSVTLTLALAAACGALVYSLNLHLIIHPLQLKNAELEHQLQNRTSEVTNAEIYRELERKYSMTLVERNMLLSANSENTSLHTEVAELRAQNKALEDTLKQHKAALQERDDRLKLYSSQRMILDRIDELRKEQHRIDQNLAQLLAGTTPNENEVSRLNNRLEMLQQQIAALTATLAPQS
ncbi:hypothetical protein O5O45_00265 [Hahella aquimaris]|uniref:hypothetical protein n=1 Tax=Hahella sp. HNIBRBA332 TaxID=3015983 RepID=UPI00273B2B17|nr:hypothetical protein [Hahella sp. HNIBRBA332]WLQ14373.1 hypothetical protein O5O45_00265 [Hahella sp. HNIBRBA332]